MNELNDRLRLLFQKLTDDSASQQEFDELFLLIGKEENETFVKAILMESLRNDPYVSTGNSRLKAIIQRILSPLPEGKVKRMFSWKKIAVAASILLVIGLGTAALVGVFTNKPEQEIANTQEQRFKNDVNPGGYKAKLTLADGRIIVLDSAESGELARQGKTIILNKDGQLVYDAKGKTTEVLYNTLSTSKGETYATVLADGSKVWLNSASSIKYPVAFIGNERKVEITGEAYFEVARDTKKKFIVTGNGVTTEVLGTHFNVNAYDNESDIKVTLLEGSVRVTSASSAVKIKPGEQAVATLSEVEVHHSPDLAEVMAWKNGMFKFKDATIEPIMRQIERWYDVEVVFEGKVTEHFITTIPRNVPVSQVFKYLETTGRVHFKIEGRKVTVMK